jgi:hypothetical protein
MMIPEANKEPVPPNDIALLPQFLQSLKKMDILNY